MPIRDHYRTLEIHPQATPQEIRQAYRRLAHLYHPDKNPDNEGAAAYFHEIREAYEILSHPRRRAAYDKERWLAGYAPKKKPAAVTPAWIYSESLRLADHMATVDTYRMSHEALHAYAELLLSETHMAILLRGGEAETNARIAATLLGGLKNLRYRYFALLADRLSILATGDAAITYEITQLLQRKKKEDRWHRQKPWVISGLAILLCLLMFLYVRLARGH
jgi:curved DNA-binding protein CbpA